MKGEASVKLGVVKLEVRVWLESMQRKIINRTQLKTRGMQSH